MPDAIEQVTVPEVLPEIVSIESGEVAAPQSSNPTPAPPPQPAASAAPSPSSAPSTPPIAPAAINVQRAKALDARRARKQEKLEKIMRLAHEKGSIKNDDVQLLLAVTDTTVTNYLNELVKAGKLKRVGGASHATYEPL